MATPAYLVSIVLSTILNTGIAPDYPIKDIACMSEAIFFEAGNRPRKEKEAVALVILNRLYSNAYPKTICGITEQKGQFSYQRQNKVSKMKSINDANIADSTLVALRAMDGRTKDYTGGATHFVNLSIATDTAWLSRMVSTYKIGAHTFYKARKV